MYNKIKIAFAGLNFNSVNIIKLMALMASTIVVIAGVVFFSLFLLQKQKEKDGQKYIQVAMELSKAPFAQRQEILQKRFDECSHPTYKILLGFQLLAFIKQNLDRDKEINLIKQLKEIAKTREVPNSLKAIIDIQLDLLSTAEGNTEEYEMISRGSPFKLLHNELTAERILTKGNDNIYVQKVTAMYQKEKLPPQMLKRFEYILYALSQNNPS